MFESLFGAEMPLAARFFIAFLVVLALIGLTAWLVRRFGANRLGNAARGRHPRLAVIDAATVDGRRRLVLIRRDNIEHLLMIGGPTDLVVEPNIVRAVAARDVAREQARAAPANESTARQQPTIENGWPLRPATEPTPAPRLYRSAATEEPWLAPEPGARPRPADSLAGLAAELSTRLTPPDVAASVALTEPTVPAQASAHEPAAQADHSLAEMAHQLEAALRRVPAPEGRPPVTDPLAARAAQDKATDITARPPQRELRSRGEAKFEAKPEPKLESKTEPKFDFKPEPRTEPPATPAKNLYEDLEEEMASLLGRPPGKS